MPALVATGLTPSEEAAFRRKQLSVQQREALIKPFLPKDTALDTPPTHRLHRTAKPAKKPSHLKSLLFFATYHLIALLFSIFFRFRRAYRLATTKVVSLLRYHHRTPEFIALDVSRLDKLPRHLSVVVELNEDDEGLGNAGLEGLVNDVCELAAWAGAAGIKELSVYERTGKTHLSLYHSTPLRKSHTCN
jgi:dehydrodolichyl diphosphate syntase complex subunit NUS1